MSSKENVKTVCPICKGDGYLGYYQLQNKIYWFLCHKCFGNGEIDWISNIIKPKIAETWHVLSHTKNKNLRKNIVFKFSGTMYFVTIINNHHVNIEYISRPIAAELKHIVDVYHE